MAGVRRDIRIVINEVRAMRDEFRTRRLQLKEREEGLLVRVAENTIKHLICSNEAYDEDAIKIMLWRKKYMDRLMNDIQNGPTSAEPKPGLHKALMVFFECILNEENASEDEIRSIENGNNGPAEKMRLSPDPARGEKHGAKV